ncbi:MAG: SurA N-terminal domain-containing protein [Lachnospiraceae bacterium]|nr:SurA N-terminal domain-containing protein [Lachnospiraceae bacterium]
MIRKKIAGAILAAVMTASFILSGCSANSIDPGTTVATIGDTKIAFGLANILLRMQQANYDTYYKAYFGDDMWTKDEDGSGETLGENVKKGVMDSLQEMYAADAHKSEYNIELTEQEMNTIKETAKSFMNRNGSVVKSGYAVTREEDVAELLRLYTVRTKVANAIKATADKNVTDEEAAQRSFSYVSLDLNSKAGENGDVVDLTDDEKAEVRKKMAKLAEDAKAGGNFDELAKAIDETVKTDSYGKNDDGTVEEVRKEADKLKEGEYSEPFEADGLLFVIRLDKEFDREATDNKKKSIISEREQAKYEEVTTPWKEALEVKTEETWSKVGFERTMALSQGK